MPTRIRLQRKGKKGRPYYHIVVADQRSPRDGKFIEQIGAYDPNHNPAFIEVNMDKAMDWLQKGAQPSDTCRAILSYKGLLYKNHLANGVKKGAFTQEEAERRFDIWNNEKTSKVEAKRTKVAGAAESDLKARLADETKKAAKMAEAISAKLAAAEPAAAPVVEAEAPAEAAPVAEAPAATEAPVAEAPAATEGEAPKAE